MSTNTICSFDLLYSFGVPSYHTPSISGQWIETFLRSRFIFFSGICFYCVCLENDNLNANKQINKQIVQTRVHQIWWWRRTKEKKTQRKQTHSLTHIVYVCVCEWFAKKDLRKQMHEQMRNRPACASALFSYLLRGNNNIRNIIRMA